MVAASLANKNLVTINLDWRSTQHRNAAEGHLMRNQDLVRKERRASAAAAAAAPAAPGGN